MLSQSLLWFYPTNLQEHGNELLPGENAHVALSTCCILLASICNVTQFQLHKSWPKMQIYSTYISSSSSVYQWNYLHAIKMNHFMYVRNSIKVFPLIYAWMGWSHSVFINWRSLMWISRCKHLKMGIFGYTQKIVAKLVPSMIFYLFGDANQNVINYDRFSLWYLETLFKA